MKVWLLHSVYDYEGSSVIGVYANEQAAIGDREALTSWYIDRPTFSSDENLHDELARIDAWAAKAPIKDAPHYADSFSITEMTVTP